MEPGFIIQAITKDIDFTQAEQEDGYRQELEQLAAEKGNEYLHQMLLEVDPVSAKEIHANNVKTCDSCPGILSSESFSDFSS